jgi:hypothetical protein
VLAACLCAGASFKVVVVQQAQFPKVHLYLPLLLLQHSLLSHLALLAVSSSISIVQYKAHKKSNRIALESTC